MKLEKNEESKDGMPEIILPDNVILQSDQNGVQKLPKMSRLSWFTSLCNCFRPLDTKYSNVADSLMLNEQLPEHIGKNTLILDLDETLVHSSFSPISADINMEIEVESHKFNVYVLKRPGVDEFLKKCSQMFEVVVFTASLAAYANPLLDILDKENLVAGRLFRESCSFVRTCYVKDLTRLGRSLKHTIIVDVRCN